MSRPSWIVANVVAGLQDIVAELETIAASNKLDATKAAAFSCLVASGPAPSLSVPAPTSSIAGIGNALVSLYNAIPIAVSDLTGVDPSIPVAAIAIARAIGGAMDASFAVAAFAAAADAQADAPPAPTSTANRQVDANNAAIVARLARLTYLAPYAEALVSVVYGSRQDAITARADCVERFEREQELCVGAIDLAACDAMTKMRDACVAYLSQAIIATEPVITVQTNQSMPSLWCAWRLYQDPLRADDLIARNDVPTPHFMPTNFEALAPSS